MSQEDRWHWLRERGRGVLWVVVIATLVCIVGLAMAGTMTMVMT